MRQYRISGLPVVDERRRAARHRHQPRPALRARRRVATRLVREVMTPMPLVTAPVGISADDAMALLRQHKIEKLPLVDDDGPAHAA